MSQKINQEFLAKSLVLDIVVQWEKSNDVDTIAERVLKEYRIIKRA